MIPPSAAKDRLDVLHEGLLGLKAEARTIDAQNWWLSASELTTLGYKQIAREILELLSAQSPHNRRHPGSSSGGRWDTLDWGGGAGFLSYFLEGLGCRNVYYDFVAGQPGFEVILSHLEGQVVAAHEPVTLPFADSSFDAVVSCGVLEHVPDPDGSVAEIRRILRPGGLFFVYHYPNRWSYTEYLARHTGRPSHDRRLSKSRFLSVFDRAGLEVLHFQYKYLVPRNLVDMPRLRAMVSAHAARVFQVDRALTSVPCLRLLANSLNAIARKPVEPIKAAEPPR
jgi:SAM-dependent methyltransferase